MRPDKPNKEVWLSTLTLRNESTSLSGPPAGDWDTTELRESPQGLS